MRSPARIALWTFKNGLFNLYRLFQSKRLFEFEASADFKPGNSSITDGTLWAAYPSLCGHAASDDEIFSKFRSSRIMVEALDHVTFEQGESYIAEILMKRAWSKGFTEALQKVDEIGKPRNLSLDPTGCFPQHS